MYTLMENGPWLLFALVMLLGCAAGVLWHDLRVRKSDGS